jgi:hypothetical protein
VSNEIERARGTHGLSGAEEQIRTPKKLSERAALTYYRTQSKGQMRIAEANECEGSVEYRFRMWKVNKQGETDCILRSSLLARRCSGQ